jgi:biotin transport system substrate-specific component
MMLGKRLGAASALVYLAVGLVGIPVFTQGGGIGYVLKPSFGYLIGFVVAAYITGAIARKAENPSFWRLLIAALVGLAALYVLGTAYFYFLSNYYLGNQVSVWTAVLYCFLVFVPGDLLKSIIAALIAKRMIPVLRKNSLS